MAPIAKHAAKTAAPTRTSYLCSTLSGRHATSMAIQPNPRNNVNLKPWRGFVGISSSLIDRTRTKNTSARIDPNRRASRTNRSPEDRYCVRNACSTSAAANLVGSPIRIAVRRLVLTASKSVADQLDSSCRYPNPARTRTCTSRAPPPLRRARLLFGPPERLNEINGRLRRHETAVLSNTRLYSPRLSQQNQTREGGYLSIGQTAKVIRCPNHLPRTARTRRRRSARSRFDRRTGARDPYRCRSPSGWSERMINWRGPSTSGPSHIPSISRPWRAHWATPSLRTATGRASFFSRNRKRRLRQSEHSESTPTFIAPRSSKGNWCCPRGSKGTALRMSRVWALSEGNPVLR